MGLLDYFKGFAVPFKVMFERRVTTEYPKVKRAKAVRHHGRHVLNRYEDGMETVSYTHLTLPTNREV